MKKIFKITALLLSVIMLFSSCGKASPDKITENVKSYLDKNDLTGCLSYLSGADAGAVAKASDAALDLVIDKFSSIQKPYENNDALDITLIDKAFVNNCVSLWKIASTFTPNEEKKFNESLEKLRYYSEASDTMRYKELFRMIEDMHECGYFYSLQKALNDYEVLGESASFDDALKTAASFKFSNYDPNEYYISELREACEKMNKYLTSATNGFATNDTAVVAAAISNIYSDADTFLFACDTVNSVYNVLSDAMNTFTLNGAFAQYSGKDVTVEQREYSADTGFSLSNVFSQGYIPPVADDTGSEVIGSTATNISKSEAVKIAVNAINKTKNYRGEVTISGVKSINIKMTSFKTESEITSAVSLVRVSINEVLNKSNGSFTGSKIFKNGVSDDETLLSNSVPPAGRTAALNSSAVESYSAVKGSGGYVITLNLKACTSTEDDLSSVLLGMVDGFYFDENADGIQHKTYYGPTAISLIVNNSGYLVKYGYGINGVSSCKFLENNEPVATGDFSFVQQFAYTFTY